MTEEEQLKIAIQKSLQEAGAAQTHSDDSDDYEEPTDDESEAGTSRTNTPRKCPVASTSKNTAKMVKPLKIDGDSKDTQNGGDNMSGPMTRLMLRLPNGKSEVINRSSSSTIGELVAFIQRNYRSLVCLETCRINCPAIRKDLYDIDKCQTLEEAKLHPSAVLHISSDD